MKYSAVTVLLSLLFVLSACAERTDQFTDNTDTIITSKHNLKNYNVNGVLGPDATKNIIKADIPGFAKIMSEQEGFAEPVGAYNSRVAQLKTDTDNDLTNGEITNIQLFGNAAPGGIELQKIRTTGETVGIIYQLTNDNAGQQKMNDLIAFFGLDKQASS